MQERSPLPVDMSAHVGLRGLLTIWIVVFHSLLYSEAGYINLEGSSLMTLFFLLSGFSLGVVYLDKAGAGCCYWMTFYQNRLARVYPVYVAVNLLCIPVTYLGWFMQADVGLGLLHSFVPFSTWVFFALGSAFVGASWTIPTLLFFYLCFPLFARICRAVQHRTLAFIVAAYLFQLFAAVMLISTTGSFYMATMTPLPSRFGVFVMGMLAAMDGKRVSSAERGYGSVFTPLCFGCKRNGGGSTHQAVTTEEEGKPAGMGEDGAEELANSWATFTDWTAVVLLVMTAYYAAIDTLTKLGVVANIPAPWSSGAFWLQILNPWPCLLLVVGLSRDHGKSYVSWVVQSSFLKWFGKMSMSIYLVHEMLIYYACVVYRTRVVEYRAIDAMLTLPDGTQVPSNQLSMTGHMALGEGMPWWGVFVILPLSTLLGWLLTIWVEVPLSKCLRSSRR